MLLALTSTLVMLSLGAACAHRLWHAERLWQALVFIPPMIATWAGSMLVRTPSDSSALLTFVAGDVALYGLAVLGVMRMLGELPVRSGAEGLDEEGGESDDGGGGGGGNDIPPRTPDRRGPGGGLVLRPSRYSHPVGAHPPRRALNRRRVRDAQRVSRARSRSSSARSATTTW